MRTVIPRDGGYLVLAHWWGRTWTVTSCDPRETSLIARLPEGVLSGRGIPERW